ncbi:MAG TPA: carbohydrate kinase family protein [Pseudonocardiaceae bacterium]|nr:carbohydrate kinase family protein [Pseudonocardiaceae bacterium]
MGPTILVAGDAGLDVLARPHGPIVPGEDSRAEVRTALGGAAANTAAWLAAGGADPVLVGRVGEDPAGGQVRAELTAAGVRCALTTDPDARTCCVVVLVDEHGQRSMLPDRGAGARLSPADLPTELLTKATHLHLSGYVLLDETSRPAGIAMLAAARAAGLTTSVDPQSAALIGDPAWLLAALTGVDLLLPNEAEVRALTGAADPAALLDTVGAVAMTMGARGARWMDQQAAISVPGQAVTCVDTTGAGDAFNGGLLAAWCAGASRADALGAGVAAASQAIGRLGAHPPR